MTDSPIRETTKLMEEQARSYVELELSCAELCKALIIGEPVAIDALTRGCETELFPMRARLVRIVRSLTVFAEARALAPGTSSLSPEAREAFEAASNSLLPLNVSGNISFNNPVIIPSFIIFRFIA